MSWKVFNTTKSEQTLKTKKGKVSFVRKDNVFKGDANRYTLIEDHLKKDLESQKKSRFKYFIESGDFSVVEVKGGKKGEEIAKNEEASERVKVI